MDNSEIYSENNFHGANSELEQDDGQPLYQYQKPVRDSSSSPRRRLVAVCLGLLSVLLLTVDIALGIHYHNIRNGELELYHNLTQISNELERLGIDQLTMIRVKEQLAELYSEETYKSFSINSMERIQINLASELLREIKDLQEEKTKLQSRISELEESCGRCSPGWELLNSMCYYFTFSDTISQQGWIESRNDCIGKAADLAVIDTWEKQELISKIIFQRYSSTPMHLSGFWIGLTDADEEGKWKWRNETEVDQGYWDDGEPNNHYGVEDCGAIYPRTNSRKNWNDAPCGYPLKWICEKKPTSST